MELPKNLAYTNGRSSEDGITFIAGRPRFCTLPLTSAPGPKGARGTNRRLDGDRGGRGDRRWSVVAANLDRFARGEPLENIVLQT